MEICDCCGARIKHWWQKNVAVDWRTDETFFLCDKCEEDKWESEFED